MVEAEAEAGVPEITPVAESIVIPVGSDGETDHVIPVPLYTVGDIGLIGVFLLKV